MENISAFNYSRIDSPVADVIKTSKEKGSRKANRKSLFNKILVEGGSNFSDYIKNQGISEEDEIMVLSSNHHYYYDENDLKNIRTLVNLKKLNMVEHLDMFLDTLYRILPPDANFIGCFTDSKVLKRDNGFTMYHSTRIFNQLINALDSKTNHYMNRNQVLNLFAANGFKVVDMTVKDGLTYFHAKSIRKKADLRA